MAISSFEMSLQTTGSVLNGYLGDKNGVPVITEDGMNRLMNEQFPHCKKEQIRSGVYQIRIPLIKTSPGVSLDKVPLVGNMNDMSDETSPGDSLVNFQEIPMKRQSYLVPFGLLVDELIMLWETGGLDRPIGLNVTMEQ